jgi:hypothetical protein
VWVCEGSAGSEAENIEAKNIKVENIQAENIEAETIGGIGDESHRKVQPRPRVKVGKEAP